MTFLRTASICIRVLALLAVLTMPCLADEKAGKKAPAKNEASNDKPARKGDAVSAPGVPAPQESAQGLGAFGMLLPLGERNLDVKIPSFKDGLPSSLIRAGSMTRLDDEYMEMEKLDIRLFGQSRDKDVRVQLVTGDYHMPTQLLSSEQRSRISREDFQLEGDSLVFDTKSQQGKMTGNVKMVIFDSSSFMGAQETKTEMKEVKPEPVVPPAGQTEDKPKTEPKNTKANDKK